MNRSLVITITAEAPPPDESCYCSECQWKGAFADVGNFHELTIPPNAALPVGLCPVCSAHAFISDTAIWSFLRPGCQKASPQQIELARHCYSDDNCMVDDDAVISSDATGDWIQAWVYLSKDDQASAVQEEEGTDAA